MVILLRTSASCRTWPSFFRLGRADLSSLPVCQQQSLLPLVHSNDAEHAALIPSGSRLDDLACVINTIGSILGDGEDLGVTFGDEDRVFIVGGQSSRPAF